jgi:prolyl-tRNA synthetase
LFKLKSRTGKEYALGQSHEEVITPLAREYVKSYKDLPMALYQIQFKYRDELRAKSGILRGREFLMKDLYSWHRNRQDFERFYEVVKKAYLKVFTRCGLTAKVTEASGGDFTDKISYEFMVLTSAGEDDILYCQLCEYCANVDIAKSKAGDPCPNCKKGKLTPDRASEVGNVFDLGQKYNNDFDFSLEDEKGEKFFPMMGCYGIGISRVMGVIVEKYADDKGIVWPESVAPYQVHLIGLDMGNKEVREAVEKVYRELQKQKVEVLYDDRMEESAGEKLVNADLIGIPWRVVVSKKTGDKLEVKKRNEDKFKLVDMKELLQMLRA